MSDDRFLRSIKDLEQVGSKWWPKEVREEATKVSILQYLLDTQEDFISLLTLADRNKPEKLFKLIEDADFEFHLFLKHLILLTDVGGEPIQRFNASFNEIFPYGELAYKIGNKTNRYKFAAMPTKGAPNNKKMQSDSLENLQTKCRNVGLCKDLIMLLIYGAASVSARTAAVLYKCNAYEYLGHQDMIREGIEKNSYRKFWYDNRFDERGTTSTWIMRNVFALS